MKKIIVALLLLTMSSACYGAASDDVYVRKDVFDAKMEAMFNRLHAEIGEVRGDIKALSERIDGVNASLSGRIDGLNASLSGRIDGLDKRIDDLRNGIYLWLVAIGLFVSWPKLKELVQKFGKSTPSITLEDVRRLIEENNARTAGKAQA